ncbi:MULTISPECIES: hypothetical protein [Microbacterium]|uniref:hypothetical protein n=1 Tax=Microbacterium TaxID=33882 RepID=UPI000D657ADF|nr:MULTISPECIES: hypothetical protein [Microbacterium]
MKRIGAARWVAITGVAALLLGVSVLAWAAYQHANPEAAGGDAEPVPTFTVGVQTPTPTPTAIDAPPVAPEEARYLALGSEQWWRATAGSCGGAAPLIERSADQGATWTDVTPTYLGIAQVQTLDAFSGRDAEVVAAMPGCTTQALRTYTRGEFWESYPDVLAASRYIDPGDAGSVRFPSGPVPAPCGTAWGLHAAGDTVALLCDGRAWLRSGAEWLQLAPEGAVAVAADEASLLVAHSAEDCAGLAVSRIVTADPASAAVVGCAEGADATSPVALDALGDDVLLWAGAELVRIARG